MQKKEKATSVRQLENNRKPPKTKKKNKTNKIKKPTNIHNKKNNQAMLLHQTKAPLSQICLNFLTTEKIK